jgi:hypothetical protein
MRLRLVSVVAALMVCSAAQANCMRETFGATICGQGPCSNDRNGKVFCAAEQYGTAVQDYQGDCVWAWQLCPRHPLRTNIVFARTRGRCRENA